MVSVSVTADDCFGEDYIIDNQPVGAVAKTHKIVRRRIYRHNQKTSTPQLLRLDAADTLSLSTITFQGEAYGEAYYIQFCVNLVAAD